MPWGGPAAKPLLPTLACGPFLASVGRDFAVDFSVDEERLILRVVNTIATNATPGEEGIGLRNVRERLSVHFGDAGALMASPAAHDRWQAQVVMPRVQNR